MHKLFHGHGGRSHTPSHVNKPLPEPLVDPDEGKTPIGELVIVPIQGRDLPNRERFGKQDPFILFKLGNVSKRSSTDVRGGQRPRWKDDQIKIRMYESDAKDATSLYVTCLDEDHQKNDLIGDCVVNLAKVLDYGEHDDWFELTYKGREAGELQLQLTYYSFDPTNPTHRANRHSPVSNNGTPARRPLHPTNGTTKVEDSPSTSVSAATTPGSTTVTTTTNPSLTHDAPMYRPPETTGPSLSVPAAGGLYPYSPGQQNGRISPLGNDGRVSPIGHDGRLSPSGQNGRISPSYQNPAGGYPSPYHQQQMQQHQMQQHQMQQYQMQQQHQMQAPTALYSPAGSGYPPVGSGYPPVGSGYPPQQNQSVGYPPMQSTMNQGYPPITNAGLGQLMTGYPPSSFPSNTGYPPMPSGSHVGGLYPPVQRPIQMTNVSTGPSNMGYPPVSYPYGASNMYPPQAPQPQQLPPDNYKVEVGSATKTNGGSGSDKNGGDNEIPNKTPNKTPVANNSLPGAWPVEADNSDRNNEMGSHGDGLGGHKQSVRSSFEPPALPPRGRPTSPPPALPPRYPQASSWR